MRFDDPLNHMLGEFPWLRECLARYCQSIALELADALSKKVTHLTPELLTQFRQMKEDCGTETYVVFLLHHFCRFNTCTIRQFAETLIQLGMVYLGNALRALTRIGYYSDEEIKKIQGTPVIFYRYIK